MTLDASIAAIADRISGRLIELRRTLHRRPELAFEEHETAATVARELGALGLVPRTGIGRTGVVAVVDGTRPGRTVGVRADLDALPIHEDTSLPYASEIPGKMHACGHDVHTVIALGVAAVATELRAELPGRVKLIFQPAEETLAGAKAMIDDGVLADPAMECIIGYHNWPALAAGTVGYCPGVVMASSDAFDITLRGRAGHGAHPHQGIDALVGAAALVGQLQTIVSREVAPLVPAVVTVGKLESGTARNIIPAEARLMGAVRTLDAATAQTVELAMRRMIEGVARANRLEHKLEWKRIAPVLANHPATLETALGAARSILGAENVRLLAQPSMGSEDFGWFADALPAAHLRIGSQIDGLDTSIHRSNYDCHDQAIAVGIKAVARAVFALAA